jgi:hypothetical protein
MFNQLVAMIELQQDGHQRFHYRDSEKREVDLIVENPGSHFPFIVILTWGMFKLVLENI